MNDKDRVFAMTTTEPDAAGLPQIAPFWERLPRFFMFPLQMDKLAFLVLLAVASIIGFLVPLPGSLGIVVVEIAIWLAAFRHAFRTMDLMAHGHIEAGAQADIIRDDPARRNLPWKMAGLLLLWGVITGFVNAVSHFLGAVLSLFVSAAIPAMTMQLCASNNFTESMAPARWWHYMRTIGWPYLALCFFLFLLMNGAPQALALFIPLLGGAMALPIVNFVLLYFNLIMFALMGYVMYQYHRELGLEVDVAPAEAAPAEEKPKLNPEAELDARVGTLLAAGQIKGAVDFAENLVRKQPDHWPACERLLKLLTYLDMEEKLREHQKHCFTVAMKVGRYPTALSIYIELAAAEDPPKLLGHQVLPLAKAAERAYDFKLAIELVRDFETRFPGHPDIPAVVFFKGRVALERLHNEEIAREHFTEMLDRHYRHELAAEAKRYLQVLERMSPKKKPTPGQAAPG
jgi:tetratricopeptide (TPR) repeat protein